MAAIRELVETVTVERDEGHPGGVKVLISGWLNVILGEKTHPDDVGGKAVAGARFVHSRQDDQPLGFIFILPRVNAR